MKESAYIGTRRIDKAPAVVGTVSKAATLEALATGALEAECDLVEVRVDLIADAPEVWRPHTAALSGRAPVILTARAPAEGGYWRGTEGDRLELYRESLDAVSAIDIELSSDLAREVVSAASANEVAVIVSYHNFEETPESARLEETIRACGEVGATVAKLAVAASGEEDGERLRALLGREWPVPVCVLAMGPLGPASRVEFPVLGSCLTYGYLDEPIAPGQVHARDLVAQLRKRCAEYPGRV